MSRLVIIGNGFDRAHYLHTSYKHFREYLIKYKDPSICEMLEQYLPPEVLWTDFEHALGELNDEQLHDDNSCYLISYGADNWHDSYHHDYQYMIEQTLSFADDIPEYLGDWIRRNEQE